MSETDYTKYLQLEYAQFSHRSHLKSGISAMTVVKRK